MDWQQLSALGVVGATAGAFVWAKLRRRKRGLHCCDEAGCATGRLPVQEVVYHSRKGERPVITVKMK